MVVAGSFDICTDILPDFSTVAGRVLPCDANL